MEKNEEFQIDITDMDEMGDGIGHLDGFTFFVKNAVIGDCVIAHATKVKKNYGYAKTIKVVKRSEARIEPPCENARRCGGCQLLEMSYDRQLEFKKQKVENCIKRLGGIDSPEVYDTLPADEPFFYRNKAQYPVGTGPDGRLVIGFYAARTHFIIDSDKCYIEDKSFSNIVGRIRSFLTEFNIRPYNEVTHGGIVRHLLLRKAGSSGEIMLCLVINSDKFPHGDELKQLVAEYNKENEEKITSLCLNVNKKDTNVILGDKLIYLYGKRYITDKIGELAFNISPLSFYQVNPAQTVKLYEKALEFADISKNDVVWDLYCGIGTISLFLAKNAKKVIGVEIVPQAIENAKENAKLNNVDNAEFYCGAAEETVPELIKKMDNASGSDVVVVDPPRSGLAASLVNTIIGMKPKKLVYVSCEPSTMGRDIKLLCDGGFKFIKAQPVDMFPQCVGVETVSLLSRKEI